MFFVLILTQLLGAGLGEAYSNTNCDGIEQVSNFMNNSVNQAASTVGSRTLIWTAGNSWAMNSSLVMRTPDHQTATITRSSTLQSTLTLGTSSNLSSPQEPSVQVEAVVEIQIDNLSGAATIDLTKADSHATSLGLRYPFTFLPSILIANKSH
jgi:hypothetical protein